MRVLLDTCTLAEVRKPDGNAAVKQAVRRVADEDLFLSVLSVGEITKGIALLAAGKKKTSLSSWLPPWRISSPNASSASTSRPVGSGASSPLGPRGRA